MDILSRLYGIISSSPHFTMLEFGACDGYHTNEFLKMLHMVGRPFMLHSFEPEPANYARCVSAARRHSDLISGRLQLWPLAIGAEIGEVPFYVSGGQKIVDDRIVDNYYGSSSLRAPKEVTRSWPAMTFKTSTAKVTTLDAFAAEHLVDQTIDFIWADIQGAQGDLVRGGSTALKRTRFLYTEYDNSEMYEGEVVGLDGFCALLPDFVVVEDYGGDVLLHNKVLP
jgi:FkbM family methyltransferase